MQNLVSYNFKSQSSDAITVQRGAAVAGGVSGGAVQMRCPHNPVSQTFICPCVNMVRSFARMKSFQRYIDNRALGREQESKRWLLTKFRMNGHPHARVVRTKKLKKDKRYVCCPFLLQHYCANANISLSCHSHARGLHHASLPFTSLSADVLLLRWS